MKKTIFFILILLSVVAAVIRFSGKATEIILNIKPKSGLQVMSQPPDAKVFLNNKEVGKTPYEDQNLQPDEYLVKIQKDETSWQGKVKLTPQTLTVINRELSKDGAFGAGEILSLDKGDGLTVISNPTSAEVDIDGKLYGTTPLFLDIPGGEYTISVYHTNYLKRSIKAFKPDGFNLIVSVDLELAEADLTTVSIPKVTQTPIVLVLETPTGFLRVRDKPSLSGKEIARVKVGDSLVLLEEQSGWVRVRLSDGTEGYVSSTYVEKQMP